MKTENLNRVARFYGVDEDIIVRRQGNLLESNLQNFKDLMMDVILEKVAEKPELLKPFALKAISDFDSRRSIN